jgi:hypothetical protein
MFPAALLCVLPGCVLGVAWLPDSSGFFFTTPKGDLVAYDYATKKQRVILRDKSAATTAWPAISPDGKKIALAQLGASDDKNDAVLEVVVCDLEGTVNFRSGPMKLATLKGKDFDYSTQVAWSPDAKKLVVHGQGHPNSGKGFDNAALFDFATKKLQIWEQHVPAYFGGSPIRPDGAGFLLMSSESNETPAEYAWVDWSGKKQKIVIKDERQEEDEPQPWTALANSRWDGNKAIVTVAERRYVIDTQKLQETSAKAPAAEAKIGKEDIHMRAKLASGVELFLLGHDDGDKSGPAMRVVARKQGDAALAQVAGPIRDRMILLQPSPGAKRAVVRVGYGYRGSKGDTIHVFNELGQLHDTLDVYGDFVKR